MAFQIILCTHETHPFLYPLENPTWHIVGMFRTSSAQAWMIWVYISAIVLHQSDINKDIKLTWKCQIIAIFSEDWI